MPPKFPILSPYRSAQTGNGAILSSLECFASVPRDHMRSDILGRQQRSRREAEIASEWLPSAPPPGKIDVMQHSKGTTSYP